MLQMKSERLLNCQLDFQKELFLLWHHSLEELQRLRSLKQQENTLILHHKTFYFPDKQIDSV